MLTKCFCVTMHVLLGKVAQSWLLGISQNCPPSAGEVDPARPGVSVVVAAEGLEWGGGSA